MANEEQSPALEEATTTGFDRWKLLDPNSIDYGHFSGKQDDAVPEMPPDASRPHCPPFYITTAINYTNGPAHMGHAYEAVTTDVIARFYRLWKGAPTFFLTGSDEHGQKIAETARASDRTPMDICDQYATGFQVLNQRLLISNNDYVRTTSDRHKETAKRLWQKCADDIYLDAYTGWYNVREETFVTETDAALTDFKDPVSGIPYKHVEEESYFFRMSKYQEALLAHIRQHPEFIQPEQYRNLILNRLN
jgi:methionyl-tRNA synthetase